MVIFSQNNDVKHGSAELLGIGELEGTVKNYNEKRKLLGALRG